MDTDTMQAIYDALPDDPDYKGTYKSHAATRFMIFAITATSNRAHMDHQRRELARLNVQVADQKRIITKIGRFKKYEREALAHLKTGKAFIIDDREGGKLMGKTTIEWTDYNFNWAFGCDHVSEACENCYAERIAGTRLRNHPNYSRVVENGKWNGKIIINWSILKSPLRWRKSRMVFVNSMSDTFHPDIPRAALKAFMGVTYDCPDSIFQVLTKRPERMREFVKDLGGFPPNVWLGVTAENQERFNERVPILLDTPAAVRFVSIEPMLGAIDMHDALFTIPGGARMNRLHQIICGGESGPGARPMELEWARQLRDQCIEAGVAYFFKRWGAYSPEKPEVGAMNYGRLLDGREWDEMPEVPE